MDSKFGPFELIIGGEDDDDEECYEDLMQEVLQEPKPHMEEPKYIDYNYEETTSNHAIGVGQSDQQLSQELNPKDKEEHFHVPILSM